MKQIMNRYSSKRLLRFLANLKIRLSPESLMVRFIEKLNVVRAVYIKENLTLLGELDYPDDQIIMKLDSYVQYTRLFACRKEPETIAWIEKYMQPGFCFYDIGANVGAYSFVACSMAGNDCLVYSFEPSFSTYSALCENVSVNFKQEKIIPINVALLDKTSFVNFHYSSLLPGAAEHELAHIANGKKIGSSPQYIQPVLGFRLDDFIEQFDLPLPNLMKIDVDGAEYRVLRGAENVLASRDLHTILVEIEEQRPFYNDLVSFLIERGFKIESKHPRGNSATLYNYIFSRVGA